MVSDFLSTPILVCERRGSAIEEPTSSILKSRASSPEHLAFSTCSLGESLTLGQVNAGHFPGARFSLGEAIVRLARLSDAPFPQRGKLVRSALELVLDVLLLGQFLLAVTSRPRRGRTRPSIGRNLNACPLQMM